MPRQKLKLLYLQKILLEQTDEEHGLTASEIIEKLSQYGISAERKSLYDDLEKLEVFGVDICRTKSNTTKYYVASRDFEVPELKLLVDAIQSSKFITHKKSYALIKKLEQLVSVYQGKELQRQVYVTNRVKTVNEKIYYNVDTLHNAISNNRQITFRYMQWTLNFAGKNRIEKTPRRNGELYNVSPWALCWDDENYYLIAYDNSAQMIKHYRVDKMENIAVLQEKRLGGECFKSFDLAGYAKKVFSMFGGDEVQVEFSVDNSLVGVIADRFGKDVFITRESDSTFNMTASVVLSPQFYAWVFGLSDKIKILSPQSAADDFNRQIRAISALYEENS